MYPGGFCPQRGALLEKVTRAVETHRELASELADLVAFRKISHNSFSIMRDEVRQALGVATSAWNNYQKHRIEHGC